MKRNSILNRIIATTIIMVAMLFFHQGCSENSMSADSQIELLDMPVVNSSTGPISLLKVRPDIQRENQNKKERLSLQKTTYAEVDSTLFYAKVYAEPDKDVKLEIKNDENGDCKVEIKKDNQLPSMDVVFIWAEDNVYEGELYSPDYSGEVVFIEPAKVELAYKNADWQGVGVEDLGFYELNEATDTWEKLESKISDDKLEVYLTKFGKFKIFHEISSNHFADFFRLGSNVFFTKKFIKEQKGGKLQIGDKSNGKSKITFKKYDLPEDLEIEFKWAADGTVSGLLNNMKFGPHGTNFRNPIEVELSYKMADLSGFDETKLSVYYHNEEEDIWEFIGGEVDIKNKKIIVYLEHFSRYAVGLGR